MVLLCCGRRGCGIGQKMLNGFLEPDAHSHSTLNDEELLARFNEGGERAFRQLL